MYTLRVDDKKDTKKAKGIKNNVIARYITFNDYTRLNDTIEMTRRQSCKIEIARSIHHIWNENRSEFIRR